MARKPIKPKALVLDLLSTLRTGSMSVRALIAAGELFDIDPNRIRVAVTRALCDGSIERDRRGAYRLRVHRGFSELVAGWRRLEARTTRWKGAWIVVLTSPARSTERGVRRRSDRALHALGFRAFQRGVAVRPANWIDSLDTVHRRLVGLGLPAETSIALMDSLDDESDRRARRLWDTESIRRGYENSIATLEASRRRLPRIRVEQAMVESFTVGGSVIRQLVLDPLLPPPLVPAGELAALVRSMRAYETAGRAAWRDFLGQHGVDFARAPANLSARDPATAMEISSGGLL